MKRTTFSSCSFFTVRASSSFGIPVTAYVARFSIPLADWGWRLVFVWGSLGLLFALFAAKLEESPRWFEDRGRYAEADEVLARIEQAALAEGAELAPVALVEPAGKRAVAYRELFSPPYLPRTIVLIAISMYVSVGCVYVPARAFVTRVR